MSTKAPHARLINALTGEKAPAAFFKALSEADHFCAELDELHELRTRVAELEESLKLANADADEAAETIGHLIRERDELMTDLALTNAEFGQTSGRLKAERDNLASDLVDLREAHMHTVTALAQARGERDTFRARIERSGW